VACYSLFSVVFRKLVRCLPPSLLCTAYVTSSLRSLNFAEAIFSIVLIISFDNVYSLLPYLPFLIVFVISPLVPGSLTVFSSTFCSPFKLEDEPNNVQRFIFLLHAQPMIYLLRSCCRQLYSDCCVF